MDETHKDGTNGETSETTEETEEHSGEQVPQWAQNLQASVSALREEVSKSKSQASTTGEENPNPAAPAPLVVETPPLPRKEATAQPTRKKVAARRLSLRPRR